MASTKKSTITSVQSGSPTHSRYFHFLPLYLLLDCSLYCGQPPGSRPWSGSLTPKSELASPTTVNEVNSGTCSNFSYKFGISSQDSSAKIVKYEMKTEDLNEACKLPDWVISVLHPIYRCNKIHYNILYSILYICILTYSKFNSIQFNFFKINVHEDRPVCMYNIISQWGMYVAFCCPRVDASV